MNEVKNNIMVDRVQANERHKNFLFIAGLATWHKNSVAVYKAIAQGALYSVDYAMANTEQHFIGGLFNHILKLKKTPERLKNVLQNNFDCCCRGISGFAYGDLAKKFIKAVQCEKVLLLNDNEYKNYVSGLSLYFFRFEIQKFIDNEYFGNVELPNGEILPITEILDEYALAYYDNPYRSFFESIYFDESIE